MSFPRAGAEPTTIKGRLKTADYARPNRRIDYSDGGLNFYQQLDLGEDMNTQAVLFIISASLFLVAVLIIGNL